MLGAICVCFCSASILDFDLLFCFSVSLSLKDKEREDLLWKLGILEFCIWTVELERGYIDRLRPKSQEI